LLYPGFKVFSDNPLRKTAIVRFHPVLKLHNALAFHRFGHNNKRAFVIPSLCLPKGFPEDLKIMARDFLDTPSEGFEFLAQRFKGMKVLGKTGELQMVTVNNKGQVVKSVPQSKGKAFPVCALIKLSVACKDKDVKGSVAKFESQGQANPQGKTMTQRACRSVHSRYPKLRMDAKEGLSSASVLLKELLRKEPFLSKNCVKRKARVTLGEHQLIPLSGKEIIPTDVEDTVKETGENLNNRE
jgi:hypothetical protein